VIGEASSIALKVVRVRPKSGFSDPPPDQQADGEADRRTSQEINYRVSHLGSETCGRVNFRATAVLAERVYRFDTPLPMYTFYTPTGV